MKWCRECEQPALDLTDRCIVCGCRHFTLLLGRMQACVLCRPAADGDVRGRGPARTGRRNLLLADDESSSENISSSSHHDVYCSCECGWSDWAEVGLAVCPRCSSEVSEV